MIKNPVAFIGEQVLNSVAGAPLSADSNNQLASGIETTEVSATSNTTTNSGTDAVMNTMTITPVSGTYMVWFSSWISCNQANAVVSASIYSGGSQKTDSIRSAIPFGGAILGLSTQDIPIATQGKVTVNGSQAIEIRWNTSGGTATAHQRTMNIMRIS